MQYKGIYGPPQSTDAACLRGQHRARERLSERLSAQTHCGSLSALSGRGRGGAMLISNATTHKPRICTHWLRGACLRGRACTFAHGDDELQASASSSGPGAAPVQVSRLRREEICAARQYAAPMPRPLQFEPHGSIFTLAAPASASPKNDFFRDGLHEEHSPTTKRALSNYEAFHGPPAGCATVLEVARSSAGVHWSGLLRRAPQQEDTCILGPRIQVSSQHWLNILCRQEAGCLRSHLETP
jgi:hypothetical protein